MILNVLGSSLNLLVSERAMLGETKRAAAENQSVADDETGPEGCGRQSAGLSLGAGEARSAAPTGTRRRTEQPARTQKSAAMSRVR